MRHLLPVLALALVVAGCSSAPPATAQAPFSPADFVRTATPFPVEDEAAELAHPFAGGFWAPVPQLVDLTGDGRPDLALGVGGAGIGVYANTPTGWVWQEGRFSGITPGPWFRFGDVDGDGDPDLYTRGLPGQVRYYENVGTPEAPQMVLRADPLLTASGGILQIEDTSVPALADVDGDGDLDFVAGKADLGTLTFYRMERLEAGIPVFTRVSDEWKGIQIFEGNPQCIENVQGESPRGTRGGRVQGSEGGQEPGRPSRHGANSLTMADLSGNEAPEMFWGDFFTERIFYFRNTGTPQDPEFELVTESFPEGDGTPGGQNAAAFGDVDGDGDLDLVVGVLGGLCVTDLTPTHNLVHFTNVGTRDAPAFTRETTRLLPAVDHGRRSAPALADIDGDGDLDLIVGDGNTDANLSLYINEGSSGSPRYRLTDSDWLGLEYDFGGYAPTFGDLDADGDADLLVGGFNGRLAYLENTGSATSPVYVFRDGRYANVDAGQYAKPVLVDIDGDGDLDLFVGESNGRVFVYRNAGSPEAATFLTTDRGTPTDDDLAWRDAVGLPDDVGQESAPDAADIDGDGDLDIVVGTGTGAIQLYQNIGTSRAPVFQASGELPAERLTTVPRLADVTGDGRPDLIVGNDAGGLLYWGNAVGVAMETPPPSGGSLGVYPNPASGAVRVEFGRVVRGDLVIRDARGREVRRVAVAAPEAVWDGRDAAGEPAPSGVYLLAVDGETGVAQVTLAR